MIGQVVGDYPTVILVLLFAGKCAFIQGGPSRSDIWVVNILTGYLGWIVIAFILHGLMAGLAEQVGEMVGVGHLRSKSTQPDYPSKWTTL